MSNKHLRGQRRTAYRQESLNIHKEPVMDERNLNLTSKADQNLKTDETAMPESNTAQGINTAEDKSSVNLSSGEEVKGLTARDLSQPDIGLGAAELGGSVHEEFPNGDDPDRVPVTPELPDDQVPNMPGAILKHAREMLGLSQREVANRLEVRVNTISDIEHDRLNQPTAVPFASALLTAYAKLVNVDAVAVTELYRQNVSRTAAQSESRAVRTRKSGVRPLRLFLYLILIALILALGIFIGIKLSGSGASNESDSGALTLSQDAQRQISKPESEQALEPIGPGQSQNAQEQSEAEAGFDNNTQMARQQAEELGTNEIIAKAQKPQDEKGNENSISDQGALSVKGAAAHTASTQSAGSDIAVPQDARSEGSESPKASVADNAAPAANSKGNGGRLLTAVPKDNAGKTANTEVLRSSKEKKESEKDTPNAAAPSSLGQVRTVSARVVNRRDIGSLNSVTVRVKGSVYLRILGNGKVLRQGQFKAGQSVSATGMPPIRIEVSDSSKVTVSYNGGTVAAGSGTNVGFDLPTR